MWLQCYTLCYQLGDYQYGHNKFHKKKYMHCIFTDIFSTISLNIAMYLLHVNTFGHRNKYIYGKRFELTHLEFSVFE